MNPFYDNGVLVVAVVAVDKIFEILYYAVELVLINSTSNYDLMVTTAEAIAAKASRAPRSKVAIGCVRIDLPTDFVVPVLGNCRRTFVIDPILVAGLVGLDLVIGCCTGCVIRQVVI